MKKKKKTLTIEPLSCYYYPEFHLLISATTIRILSDEYKKCSSANSLAFLVSVNTIYVPLKVTVNFSGNNVTYRTPGLSQSYFSCSIEHGFAICHFRSKIRKYSHLDAFLKAEVWN